MEKITKAHINSFQIPKIIVDFLKCSDNNLIKWEINKNTDVVKFSCVEKSDYPNVRTDTSYIENDNIILYRRFYKQGSTSFPIVIRQHINFKKGQLIKWTTTDDKEVIIEKVERTKLIDLSGIAR